MRKRWDERYASGRSKNISVQENLIRTAKFFWSNEGYNSGGKTSGLEKNDRKKAYIH